MLYVQLDRTHKPRQQAELYLLAGRCPSHGTFHCLGCGEAGDARAFTAKIRYRRVSAR